MEAIYPPSGVFEDSVNVYEPKDARETKAALQQIRKPYKPDHWISTADFAWKVGEKNADFTIFDLMVRDDYFHTLDADGNKMIKTSIIIQKKTYMNPDDARQAVQDGAILYPFPSFLFPLTPPGIAQIFGNEPNEQGRGDSP